MRILGIDPGSHVSGFGLLESNSRHVAVPQHMNLLTAGVLKFDRKLQHSQRIYQLYKGVKKLLIEAKPDTLALEKAFCGININSALKLGEARGAIITAAHEAGVSIREVTPAEVKKFIAGNGRATKEQLAQALEVFFKRKLTDQPADMTDAIAIALYAALNRSLIQNQAISSSQKPNPALW